MHFFLMNRSFILAACCAATLAGAPAHAHVGLEYAVAPAGSRYKATFQIVHGCGAAATRQIVVDIPAGVRHARPMPKPGWEVEIERARAAEAGAVGEVQEVRWTARTRADMLPADQYDEFSLVARMPAQPGPLAWPVQQLCEGARHDWTEVPTPGRPAAALHNPAPVLEVLPTTPGAAHAH